MTIKTYDVTSGTRGEYSAHNLKIYIIYIFILFYLFLPSSFWVHVQTGLATAGRKQRKKVKFCMVRFTLPHYYSKVLSVH